MKTLDLAILSTVTGGGKKANCTGLINNCGNKTDESSHNKQTIKGNNNTGIQAPITVAPKVTLPFPGAPE